MKKKVTLNTIKNQSSSLTKLLDILFDGVYIVDRSRRIIFWNKGAEQITGYKKQEVTGHKCSEGILNHIDENGKLLCKSACPLQKSMLTGKNVKEKIYPLHKSGKRFPVLTHISPIKNENGETIAGIEIFRDITKEEDYRIIQEKFSKLIKKYVSTRTFKNVIQEIKAGEKAISRARDLTILYLDIVNFTQFSENNKPKEIVTTLNQVFGICEVITKECHGDIDKFIGDAIMAVFIDANDAISASLKVLKALKSFNKTRKNENKEEISLHIGINSGKVLQGEIGTIKRKDITVIGDTVNTAARIQSITKENEILISESTFSRLNNPKLFSFYKKLQLKGKRQTVKIYKYKNKVKK